MHIPYSDSHRKLRSTRTAQYITYVEHDRTTYRIGQIYLLVQGTYNGMELFNRLKLLCDFRSMENVQVRDLRNVLLCDFW